MFIIEAKNRVVGAWFFIVRMFVLRMCLNRLKKAITLIENQTQETTAVYKDLLPVTQLLNAIDDRLLLSVQTSSIAKLSILSVGFRSLKDFSNCWRKIAEYKSKRITVPYMLRVDHQYTDFNLFAFVGTNDLVILKNELLNYCRWYDETFDVTKTYHLDSHYLSILSLYNNSVIELTNSLVEAAFLYE